MTRLFPLACAAGVGFAAAMVMVAVALGSVLMTAAAVLGGAIMAGLAAFYLEG